MKGTVVYLGTGEELHDPQVAELEEWASNLVEFQIMASKFGTGGFAVFLSCFDLVFSYYASVLPL